MKSELAQGVTRLASKRCKADIRQNVFLPAAFVDEASMHSNDPMPAVGALSMLLDRN